jgi:hypothetical protein
MSNKTSKRSPSVPGLPLNGSLRNHHQTVLRNHKQTVPFGTTTERFFGTTNNGSSEPPFGCLILIVRCNRPSASWARSPRRRLVASHSSTTTKRFSSEPPPNGSSEPKRFFGTTTKRFPSEPPPNGSSEPQPNGSSEPPIGCSLSFTDVIGRPRLGRARRGGAWLAVLRPPPPNGSLRNQHNRAVPVGTTTKQYSSEPTPPSNGSLRNHQQTVPFGTPTNQLGAVLNSDGPGLNSPNQNNHNQSGTSHFSLRF